MTWLKKMLLLPLQIYKQAKKKKQDAQISKQNDLDYDNLTESKIYENHDSIIHIGQKTKTIISQSNLKDNKTKTFIENLLDMTSYEAVVAALKTKYGQVNGNYFVNEKCKSPNPKIKRTNEGLFIHHIDEDKAFLLANPGHAFLNPFEYQLADRLVYCNLLEHLVLHIKIMEFPITKAVSGSGVFLFLIPELNDIFSGYPFKQHYRQISASIVIKLEKDYLKCIDKICEILPEFTRDQLIDESKWLSNINPK